MEISNLLYIILDLVAIWFGSSLILKTVLHFSKIIKAPPFIVSFFLLGSLTSVTEMSVAINSHFSNTLAISVGNLLGGIIVIFLLIIPILAVAGNGVHFGHQYSKPAIAITMISFVLPSIFFLDSLLLKREALVIFMIYSISVLFLFIGYRNHKQKPVKRNFKKKMVLAELIKIAIGAVILLWACDNLINQILQVANSFNVSQFFISLITLSIGTNLPELSMAIRSVISGKKEIAFSNYLGSATFNLVILSALTLANGRIMVDADFVSLIIFTVVGLGLFYFFITSKNNLSRREGLVLLSLYVTFICYELYFR